MTINGNSLTVAPQDTRPQPEGYCAERLDGGGQEEISGRLARGASGAAG